MANSSIYKLEFYNYLQSIESDYAPRQNYLDFKDISSEQRSVTIDWLIALGEVYKLENETVHIAVQLFDRFLSLSTIKVADLQLAATASFFIACKYEEKYPLKIEEMVYVMDGAGSKTDLIDMEVLILKTLDFHIGTPTKNNFLTHFGNLISTDQISFQLASYYTELSLVTDSTLQFSSSVVAAASLALSRFALEINDPWPEKLVLYSRLDLPDLHECLLFLSSLAREAKNYKQTQSVRDKYGYWKKNSVSTLKPPDIGKVINLNKFDLKIMFINFYCRFLNEYSKVK